jgi:hypothetical protein
MTTAAFLVLLLSLEIKKVLTIEAISRTLFLVCCYKIFVPSIMSILPYIDPTYMSDEIIFATSLFVTISFALLLVLKTQFIEINKGLEEILAQLSHKL